jgi:hypothetical protein
MEIHKLDPEKARKEAERRRHLLKLKRKGAQKPRSLTLRALLDAVLKRRPPA